MWDTLSVAIICGTAIFLSHATWHALSRHWEDERISREREQFRQVGLRAADRDLDARRIDLEERTVALEEARSEVAIKQVRMPGELAARIRAWEDPAAQDAERQTIMDLYADLGDWQAVIAALPPLSPDVAFRDIAAPRDGMVQ
jgi:hypothetical protein